MVERTRRVEEPTAQFAEKLPATAVEVAALTKRVTRLEKALIRFANGTLADRSYGGHVNNVGQYIGKALEAEKIGAETDDEQSG